MTSLGNWKSRLKKWHFIAPSVLASVIAIAYFTAGPRVPMDNDQTSALAIAEQEAEKADESSAEFGKEITVDDLVITLSEPQPITITDSMIDPSGKSPTSWLPQLKTRAVIPLKHLAFRSEHPLSTTIPMLSVSSYSRCKMMFPLLQII